MTSDIDPKALALRVAAKVCHKDQMVVWSSEVAEALQDFISDDLDYSDIVSLHSAIERELRDIVKCALEHPETERALAAFLREAVSPWRPIETAPAEGRFLVPSARDHNEIRTVVRFRHPTFSNCVIEERTGLHWYPKWWMSCPPALPVPTPPAAGGSDA